MTALPPIAAPTTAASGATAPVAGSDSGTPGVFAELLAALGGEPDLFASVVSAFDGEPAVPPTPPALSADIDDLLTLLEKLAEGEIADPTGEFAEEGLAEIQALLADPATAALADPDLAARADALAAKLAPTAPALADALAALSSKLRGEAPVQSTPQAADADLPAEPAKTQFADLAARPTIQAPAKAELLPPPPAPRSDAVPKAASEPVEPAPPKSGSGERVVADIRFDATLTARPVIANAAPQAAQLNLPALAIEIARHVHAGMDRFQIRLDPPELGRIDVRLDLDGDRAALKLTVEKSETLDLLQRDARSLERALTQAGFNGDRPNLEFALKQQGQAAYRSDNDAGPAGIATTDETAGPTLTQRWTARAGGIDLYA